MPAQAVLLSWFQGQILHARRTRAITEAVAIYLVVSTAVLLGGIRHGRITGLYVALAGIVLGALAQVAWQGLRSRTPIRATPDPAAG